MIEIVRQPLECGAYALQLADKSCGGLCVFEGRIRTHNEGREVASLSYDCYEPMALKQMARLRGEAMSRWSLGKAVLAHRVGPVPIGEAAVWIGVAAAHRDAAFEACRFLIDEVKLKVPIWKKETYASGDCAWVACSGLAHEGQLNHSH
jgi:molybdopterin synthase catalytic subunit